MRALVPTQLQCLSQVRGVSRALLRDVHPALKGICKKLGAYVILGLRAASLRREAEPFVLDAPTEVMIECLFSAPTPCRLA